MTTYGGRSAEQRRTERRARLVEAAAGIWAEQGWAAVSMRGVCARSGLVDRYFYESFESRDALLVAVWEQARDDIAALVVEAAEADPLAYIRTAVTSIVGYIDQSPERARIVLADCAGCPPLQNARATALQTISDLLIEIGRPYLRDEHDAGVRMTVLMAVGGFVEIATAWQDGRIDADAATICEHVVTASTALAAVHFAAG
jgi:AcrR family transcriptional regulator